MNHKGKSNAMKTLFPISFGFIIWILVLFNWLPYSIFNLTHVQLLLIAAPLYLIPLSLHISSYSLQQVWLAISSGLLFTTAYFFPQGIIAGCLILPWFGFTLFLLIRKIQISRLSLNFSLAQKTDLAAFFFLQIGVFWTIIDRLGVQFLDYDPTIILLTAVHFHYAGFILPQVTSWLIKREATSISKIAGIGIIIGIPLVAIGISATHFNWSGYLEVCSVSVMTIAASIVGLLHISLGIKTKKILPKICFILGGLALIIGMSLAFCYGWRHVYIIEALTIPWMYAIHGTCNAIGFAFPILVAWKLSTYRTSKNKFDV